MKDSNTKLWIVGKVTDDTGRSWEFQGVFSGRRLAVKKCLDYRFFVAPAILDMDLPCEEVKWENLHYPFPQKMATN